MSNIYSSKDEGFSFSKKKDSTLYRGTNNDFDFKKSGATGIYGPSRNSFDFKKTSSSGERSPSHTKRERKASGGAVTEPAMPQGPRPMPQGPMRAYPMGDGRNFGNLPFKG